LNKNHSSKQLGFQFKNQQSKINNAFLATPEGVEPRFAGSIRASTGKKHPLSPFSYVVYRGRIWPVEHNPRTETEVEPAIYTQKWLLHDTEPRAPFKNTAWTWTYQKDDRRRQFRRPDSRRLRWPKARACPTGSVPLTDEEYWSDAVVGTR